MDSPFLPRTIFSCGPNTANWPVCRRAATSCASIPRPNRFPRRGACPRVRSSNSTTATCAFSPDHPVCKGGGGGGGGVEITARGGGGCTEQEAMKKQNVALSQKEH